MINIIVLSGDYAKIHAAAMITMVASSLGQPINVFVSMEALPAFHKDSAIRATVGQGPVAAKIQASGGEDYLTLLQRAKEFGDVTIYACSLVMDLHGWTLADMAPVFDDTLGINGFLAKAEGGMTLTM